MFVSRPLATLAALVCLLAPFDNAWAQAVTAYVSPELLRQAADDERGRAPDIRVIVNFDTPGSRDVVPQPAAVRSAREQVLARLPTTAFQQVASFDRIRAVSLKVNAESLEILRRTPGVTAINSDRVVRKTMVEANLLTGVGTLHGTGFTGDGQVVAIIDTGVDSNAGVVHPGLADDLVGQACFRTENDCIGGATSAEDQEGHGTHVAGMITGPNGVAPDAQFHALKVFTTGNTSDTNILNALNHVIGLNTTTPGAVDLVNMSLGGDNFATGAACDAAGVAYLNAFATLNGQGTSIFVATGNDAQTGLVGSPACITGAIGVGSTGDANFSASFSVCTDNGAPDKVSCYSNATPVQGPGELVDLLAPGCSIISLGLNNGVNATNCGTSMATPYAAGSAALVLEFLQGEGLSYTPAQLEDVLEVTGKPVLDYRIPGSPQYPRVDPVAAVGALSFAAPPSNFTITGTTTTSFSMSWTGVPEATQYRVYRNVTGAAPVQVGTTTAPTVTFTDSAAVCGPQTYFVRAFDGTALSLPSNEDTDTARACPLTPTSLLATPVSTNAVTLSWNDANADETAQILQRSLNGAAFADYQTLAPGSSLSFPETALPCGVYQYRAIAQRGADRSLPSNVVQFAACAPANDNFANAEVVVADVAITDVEANVSYASEEAADPLYSCKFGGAGPGTQGLWYRITPAVATRVTVSTAATTLVVPVTGAPDTLAAIYTHNGSAFTEIACNDDISGSNFRSTVSSNLAAGTTYYVFISQWGPVAPGTVGNLSTAFSWTAPLVTPDNDLVANARVISAMPYNNTVTAAQNATISASDLPHSCASNAAGTGIVPRIGTHTLWWTFTPTTNGSLDVDTLASSGSFTDTIMTLYSGNPGSFVDVACNDDEQTSGVSLRSEIIDAPLTAGMKYTIYVSRWSATATSTAGTVVLNATFQPTAGPPAQLAIGTQPGNTVAGVGIAPAITVNILDSVGVPTNSTANVTLAIGTNPGTGTLSGTTTVAAVNGVATFSGLSIDKVGTGYTLAASSSGLTGVSSDPFNITAAAASQLAFLQQPTNALTGAAIAPPVSVRILDAFGNQTASTASVGLAIGTNPGSSTLGGTTSLAAVAGVASFANLSLNNPGNGYTLTAASGALNGATSSAFNISCPPTVVVNGGDSGAGSLRQTIADACPGSVITFATGIIGVGLTSAELLINKNLTIDGGTGVTVIRITGSPDFRIFQIAPNTTAAFTRLTITNGIAGDGGGILNNGGSLTLNQSVVTGNTASNTNGGGGGIYNGGVLQVFDSTISSNTAGLIGGGIWSRGAGSAANATVANSAIVNNRAASGAGIHNNDSVLLLTNSTIANNLATFVDPTGGGGGVENVAQAFATTATILNCTFNDNRHTSAADPTADDVYAGNFGAQATVTLKNTILGGSAATATPNLRVYQGGIITSQGNNLSSDAGAGLLTGPGDLITTNPLLAPLGNYGGLTQTHALLPGSPAINSGNNTGAPATDQRGISRPQQGTVDIGAFESQGFVLSTISGTPQSAVISTAFAAPLVAGIVANQVIEPVNGGRVSFTAPGAGASASLATNPATIASGQASVVATANATIGAYNVTAAASGATGAPGFALTNLPNCTNNPIVANGNDAGAGSLRQAIADACAGSTITFNGSVTSSNLTTAELLINKDLTIDGGAGVTVTRVAGSPDFRIFRIAAGSTVTLDSLTASNGSANVGGVIRNQGNLTVVDALISGGNVGADGGGIYNQDGVLLVVDSTITGNTAANGGGGIVNVGFSIAASATLINASIINNRAGFTGGVFNQGASLTMTNCTIADNESTTLDPAGDGSGFANVGLAFDTTAALVNCTFNGNRQTSAATPTADDVYSGNFGTQSTVTLKNAILGGSAATATPNLRTFAGGIITSLGNNLSSDAGAGVLTGPGDLINTNPLLAPLGNYGGPTQTHALLPGSAAINAGNNTGAPTTDQRGIARPQQGTVDIGAYESRGFTLALTGGNNQSAGPGLAFANPLTATVAAIAGGEPVQGGVVTFMPPGAGASASLSPNPAPIGAGGIASSTATANATVGAYTVAAGASGATPSLSFTLTNAGADLSINDVPITEGDAATSNAVFTVSRTNALTAFSVPYSITAGTAQAGIDFTATNGTLTFVVGGPLTQTITVPVVGDLIVETTETATLNLGAVTNATGVTTITDGSGLLTISDNDNAVVAFNPISVSQTEASTPMAFTVTLSNPVQSGVTLSLNSAFGTALAADFTSIVGGTVSFPANSNANQTVNVVINNDALDENDETFTLTVSGLTAVGNVTLGAAGATGTILDDDPTPTLSVSSPSQPEGNAGNTPMNFVVSLSAISGRDVTFTRATADGTATTANNDYQPLAPQLITIPAGQLSTTIAVQIVGDTTYEGNESFSLNLTGVSNATPASISGTGTLVDDDQQPTTTTITGDAPDPSVVGQVYTVAVTVAAVTTSPLGTVTISDGSASCGPVTLSTAAAPNSTASCALTSTSAGAKTLTASYTPASSAFAASSGTTAHQVNAASTAISVVGPPRSRINQPTTFTFALSVNAPGAGSPAGTVTLTSGAATCNVTVPTATQSCALTFTTLGSRTVTAAFVPSNGNFLASSSSGAGNAQTLVYAQSDIAVTKTDVVSTYRPGDLLVYTVTVRNLGPDAAAVIRIRDQVPAGVVNVDWTCDASGGVACPAASGSGNLDITVAAFPVGGLLNFSFFGNVSGSPAQIVNTALVELPADTTIEDPVLGNNSASDTNLLDLLFKNGFEDPAVGAPAGSYRLPTLGLRAALDEVARVVYVLDDVSGEAVRVYARLHDGQVQYALASRGGTGELRLAAWASYTGEPTLSWTARQVAAGWVLETATIR